MPAKAPKDAEPMDVDDSDFSEDEEGKNFISQSRFIIYRPNIQHKQNCFYTNFVFCFLGGRRVAGIYIPPPIKPHCSTESKGPRLMITKIVCEDFKSYANTVTLGPFHHVSFLFYSQKS